MDDIEIIGILRRRMDDDLTLLDQALNAARKGKMHVVIDHLERVLAAQQHVLQVTRFNQKSEKD